MKYMELITQIQIIALAAVVTVAIIARTAVFCYWWVAGAWGAELVRGWRNRRSIKRRR